MLRTTLTKYWSNNLKCYVRTGIQLNNVSCSREGASVTRTRSLHRPVFIETDSDVRRFDGVLPQIVSGVTKYSDHRLKPAMDHFKSLIEHAVSHGHKQRGLLTVGAYKMLTIQQTEEQLSKACIMGWCVEMLQAFLISDNSLTPSGRPGWCQMENDGQPFSIGEVMAVENAVYKILRNYFEQEPYYIHVVNLFHDVTLRTTTGQMLDVWISQQKLDFNQFNQDNHDIICHKTALYTYYFPLALAMHMVTIPRKEVLEETEEICLQLGQILQVKNEYANCFGDGNSRGISGTDIEEGKCTWLIVKALELVSQDERDRLRKCYGKRDPELTKIVHNKYTELELDRLFERYIQKSHDAIATAIGQLPSTFPTNLLYYCLDTLFNSAR